MISLKRAQKYGMLAVLVFNVTFTTIGQEDTAQYGAEFISLEHASSLMQLNLGTIFNDIMRNVHEHHLEAFLIPAFNHCYMLVQQNRALPITELLELLPLLTSYAEKSSSFDAYRKPSMSSYYNNNVHHHHHSGHHDHTTTSTSIKSVKMPTEDKKLNQWLKDHL
jgi:hypothetical protein